MDKIHVGGSRSWWHNSGSHAQSHVHFWRANSAVSLHSCGISIRRMQVALTLEGDAYLFGAKMMVGGLKNT